MNKKLFKKLKKWEISLLTYLEMKNFWRQAEVSLYEYHKEFKVKDAMKNSWDGIATALRFILKLYHSFGLIY